jgi:hypothetical protein
MGAGDQANEMEFVRRLVGALCDLAQRLELEPNACARTGDNQIALAQALWAHAAPSPR